MGSQRVRHDLAQAPAFYPESNAVLFLLVYQVRFHQAAFGVQKKASKGGSTDSCAKSSGKNRMIKAYKVVFAMGHGRRSPYGDEGRGTQ